MIDKLRQMAQTAKQDGAMVLVSPETIERLLDERERYRDALNFYSEEDNYEWTQEDRYGDGELWNKIPVVEEDNGNRARQALKGESK